MKSIHKVYKLCRSGFQSITPPIKSKQYSPVQLQKTLRRYVLLIVLYCTLFIYKLTSAWPDLLLHVLHIRNINDRFFYYMCVKVYVHIYCVDSSMYIYFANFTYRKPDTSVSADKTVNLSGLSVMRNIHRTWVLSFIILCRISKLQRRTIAHITVQLFGILSLT